MQRHKCIFFPENLCLVFLLARNLVIPFIIISSVVLFILLGRWEPQSSGPLLQGLLQHPGDARRDFWSTSRSSTDRIQINFLQSYPRSGTIKIKFNSEYLCLSTSWSIRRLPDLVKKNIPLISGGLVFNFVLLTDMPQSTSSFPNGIHESPSSVGDGRRHSGRGRGTNWYCGRSCHRHGWRRRRGRRWRRRCSCGRDRLDWGRCCWWRHFWRRLGSGGQRSSAFGRSGWKRRRRSGRRAKGSLALDRHLLKIIRKQLIQVG